MLTGVPREGSGRFFNLLLVRTMRGRDGKARRVGMLSGSFSHRSRCKGQMQGWGERRHLETPRHRSVREGPRRVCGDRGGRSPRRTPSPVPHPPAARGRRRAASAPRRSMPPQPCDAARRRCSLRSYPAISRRATSRSRLPRALLPLTEAVLIFGSGRGRVGGGDEGVIGAGVGRAGSEWVWHGENWLGRLVGWLESVGCWV